MQLVHTTEALDLSALSDTAIEMFFAEFGIEVEVVTHCDDATCPSCFAPAPSAQAA